MKEEENDDFGFSFEEDNDSKDRLMGLYNMIMPLLINLKSNPEKDVIRWPNRLQQIDAFIKKMNDYVGIKPQLTVR